MALGWFFVVNDHCSSIYFDGYMWDSYFLVIEYLGGGASYKY